MSDKCEVCDQRSATVDGKWCSIACRQMTVAGLQEAVQRHALKATQRIRRMSRLSQTLDASNGNAPQSVLDELNGVATADDGVDR